MFTRIVVPLDGSALANAALPLAQTLARRTGAQIAAVAVIPPHTPGSTTETAARQFASHRLRAAVGPGIREGIDAVIAVREGPPAESIAAYAAEVGADLICMGTHGHDGMSRLLLGSVAEGVMRASTIPVLLVHPGDVNAPHSLPASVVVPLDGSTFAEEAIPDGVALAQYLDAPLTLVRVCAVYPSLSDEFGLSGSVMAYRVMPETDDTEVDAYLDTTQRRVERSHTNVSTVRLYGDPREELPLFVRSLPLSIVVMTTHGRTGVDRLLMGSVTAALVRASVAPVLLVHAETPRVQESIAPVLLVRPETLAAGGDAWAGAVGASPPA